MDFLICCKFLPGFDRVLLDEDSSRESPDGQEDADTLRSKTADNDQTKSTSPTSLTTRQKDVSSMIADGLKPAFWLTDYKQPKRCRKGYCTFQTVSKVSIEMDLLLRDIVTFGMCLA